MVQVGDIIRMKDDVPYTVTKPGTKWLVYAVNGTYVTIGTLPMNGYEASDMIRLYGSQSSRQHMQRRWDSGIKLFEIPVDEVELAGNNAFFKNKLLQGDIWETNIRKQVVSNDDWDDWIPF